MRLDHYFELVQVLNKIGVSFTFKDGNLHNDEIKSDITKNQVACNTVNDFITMKQIPPLD